MVQSVPAFVIEDTKKRLHYALMKLRLHQQIISQKWIEAFVSQTLPPTLVSAPRPEKNDGPVKIVVADTFEEIVLDTSRDVFLMVYAPCILVIYLFFDLRKGVDTAKN